MREEVLGYLEECTPLECDGKVIVTQTDKGRESCDWRAFAKAYPEMKEKLQAFVSTGDPITKVVIKDIETYEVKA